MRNVIVPVAEAPRQAAQLSLCGMVHKDIEVAPDKGAARPLAARKFPGKGPRLPPIHQHKARCRTGEFRCAHPGCRFGLSALIAERVAELANIEFAQFEEWGVAHKRRICSKKNGKHTAWNSLKTAFDLSVHSSYPITRIAYQGVCILRELNFSARIRPWPTA